MRARIAAAAVGVLWLAGCGPKVHPPQTYLPDVDEAQTDVHGAWIRVQAGEYRDIEGELIAAETDSIHVLTASGELESIRLGDAARITVVVHSTVASGYGAWTFLGTLSTASHGQLLVLTAPMWLIVGSAVTANVADQGSREYWTERADEASLVPFARFPAGWPEGLDRASLEAKSESWREILGAIPGELPTDGP